jgi:thioredoxin-related protein
MLISYAQLHKIMRLEYTEKFKRALKNWPKIRNSIPEEWYYIDFEMTVPADFDLKTMLNLLEQCKTNDFWNTP